MPTATDLVTDLPADFEVFGQAVATSMADLLGGTSGQILAKNSNTDMDFVWVANDVGDITAVTAGTGISGGGTSGAVTVTNSMATAITTAGDLIKGTGSGTFDRLGIGSSGQVLTVTAGAPAWASPAGGGKVLQVVMGTTATEKANSTTTYSDSNLTATITPTLATSKVLVLVNQSGIYIGPGSALNGLVIKLVRAATDLHIFGYRNSGNDDAIQRFGDTVSTAYLDTPATTSATAYKTQIRNYNNAAEVRVQVDNVSTSTIILMEIGA